MKSNARWSRGGLWVIVLRASPKPRERQAKDRRGAYVTCWINFRLYEGALLLAKHYVEKEGWRVRSMFSRNWVNASKELPRGSRQFFREAQESGVSLVFHKFAEPRA